MAFTFKQIFWGSLFLLVLLPPDAHPASSDGLPWSGTALSDPPGVKRDGLGALRDADMLPDGQQNQPLNTIGPVNTTAAAPIDQKNAGAAQSGPGAAGLFTPSSPGNAAALAAQSRGSLAGAPIVDGHGANLTITVPIMTPSQTPDYQSVSIRDATPGSLSGATVPAATGTGSGVNTVYSAGTESSIDTVNGALGKSIVQAFPPVNLPRSRIVHERARQNTLFTDRGDRARDLGPVNGFITYDNGDTTVFAANGIINICPGAPASLTLNDGSSIRVSPDSTRRLTQNLYTSM